MLTKILLTALVITIAWAVIRHRKRNQPPLYVPPSPPPPPPIEMARSAPIRVAAAGLGLVMILGVGWVVYDRWFDARRIVEVQVINSNTGSVATYDARKGEVDLKNGSFTTLAGRRVILAGVERMEMRTK